MDALISIGLWLVLGVGGGIALGRYITRGLREAPAENEARRARARRARTRIPNDSVQFMLVTGAMTRVDALTSEVANTRALDVSTGDVSEVTTLGNLFSHTLPFKQDISYWGAFRESDEGLENPYPRQRPDGVDL